MASIQNKSDRPKPYIVHWREQGRQRSRSFKRKSEARAWLVEAERIEAAQRSGTYTPAPDVQTVEQAGAAFLRSKEHRSRSVWNSYRSALDTWIVPAIGDLDVRQVGRRHLETIMADATAKGRSKSTRVNIYNTLCGTMDLALGKSGHTCREATAGKPKRQREVQVFSEGEVDVLLERAPGPVEALSLSVLAHQGLRPAEMLALHTDQFDWAKGTVKVDRAARRDGSVGPTKTGESRTIPVMPRVRDGLRSRCEKVASGPVFPWGTYDSWRWFAWDKAVEGSGFEDRRPYDLRHTVASELLDRGASLSQVARFMGHSERMVVEVYSHALPGGLGGLADLMA